MYFPSANYERMQIVFHFVLFTVILLGSAIDNGLAADVEYTYDEHNCLIGVDYPNGSSIGYSYDGVYNRGQRIYSTVNLPGDIDGNSLVELRDVIIDLRIAAGMVPPVYIQLANEVTGNGRVGIEEAIFGLEVVSGIR